MHDLISRQAAIDKINERQRKLIYCFGFENDLVKILDIARSIIIAMPSAQPERKRGRWIFATSKSCYVCKDCGAKLDSIHTNFCGECGADMRGDLS